MKLNNLIIKFFKVILPDPNPYIPKRKCNHSMTIETGHITDPCSDKFKRNSRYICKKCRWVDYDDFWTFHEDPMKISNKLN